MKIWPVLLHGAAINQDIADICIRSLDGSAIEFSRQKEKSNTYPVLTPIAQYLLCFRIGGICGKTVFGLWNAENREI